MVLPNGAHRGLISIFSDQRNDARVMHHLVVDYQVIAGLDDLQIIIEVDRSQRDGGDVGHATFQQVALFRAGGRIRLGLLPMGDQCFPQRGSRREMATRWIDD